MGEGALVFVVELKVRRVLGGCGAEGPEISQPRGAAAHLCLPTHWGRKGRTHCPRWGLQGRV